MGGLLRDSREGIPGAYNLSDFASEGAALLEAARAEAQQIVAEARNSVQAQLDQARQTAITEGHAEGYEAGRTAALEAETKRVGAQVRDQLAKLATAMQQCLTSFDEHKRSLLAQAERGLIELALDVAARVCKQRSQHDPELIKSNLEEVLSQFAPEGDLVIRLNPDDLSAIQTWLPTLHELSDEIQHAKLKADAGVTRGGCVLSGREGIVDATLETQLSRIAAELAPQATESREDPLLRREDDE